MLVEIYKLLRHLIVFNILGLTLNLLCMTDMLRCCNPLSSIYHNGGRPGSDGKHCIACLNRIYGGQLLYT